MMQVLFTVPYVPSRRILYLFKQRYSGRTEILQDRCVVDVLCAFPYAELYVNFMYLLIGSSELCCRLFKRRCNEEWSKYHKINT